MLQQQSRRQQLTRPRSASAATSARPVPSQRWAAPQNGAFVAHSAQRQPRRLPTRSISAPSNLAARAATRGAGLLVQARRSQQAPTVASTRLFHGPAKEFTNIGKQERRGLSHQQSSESITKSERQPILRRSNLSGLSQVSNDNLHGIQTWPLNADNRPPGRRNKSLTKRSSSGLSGNSSVYLHVDNGSRVAPPGSPNTSSGGSRKASFTGMGQRVRPRQISVDMSSSSLLAEFSPSAPSKNGRSSSNSTTGRWKENASRAFNHNRSPKKRPSILQSFFPHTASEGNSCGSQGNVSHQRWAARAFATLDVDNDGCLIPAELRCGAFADVICECFSGTLPESVMNSLVDFAMQQADTDGDGSVSLEEFQKFTWKFRRMELDTDLEIDFVFGVFDNGAKGALNLEELSGLLAFHGYDDAEGPASSAFEFARQILYEIGKGVDGEITKGEYKEWCMSRDFGLAARRGLSHLDWAKNAFHELDLDGSGYLDACELRSGSFRDKLKEWFDAIPEYFFHALVDFVVRKVGRNGDCQLNLRDFQSITWQLKRMEVDGDLEENFIFSVFDRRGTGTLTATEFEQLVQFQVDAGFTTTDDCGAKLFLEIDNDGDGTITQEEYKQWLVKRKSPGSPSLRNLMRKRSSICFGS